MTKEEFNNLKIGDIITHTYGPEARKGVIYKLKTKMVLFALDEERGKGYGFILNSRDIKDAKLLSKEIYPEEYL